MAISMWLRYRPKPRNQSLQAVAELAGGGGRIRTHENLAALLVFKTSAFNHSATPPERGALYYRPTSGLTGRLSASGLRG